MVEVGPGGGVLTRELLRVGARVLAIELDAAWAFRLAATEASEDLQLLVADALEFAWERLPAGTLVTGNLPYNVATPILQRLLRCQDRIERAAFLLQLEVAERLAATPGTRAYGALSVLVQARADVSLLGRVRPGAFRPPPKVESAFVGLRPHAPPLPEREMPRFESMIAAAFGQRRKTLRNALSASYPLEQVDRALALAGIEPGLRAEVVPLDAFVKLHNNLCS